MTERKFTQEECVQNGGHFWRYYKQWDKVDENFNQTGLRYAMACMGKEPEYRGCPLCGRVECHVNYWKESEKN